MEIWCDSVPASSLWQPAHEGVGSLSHLYSGILLGSGQRRQRGWVMIIPQVSSIVCTLWTLNIMLQEGDARKSKHPSRVRVNPLQHQFKTVSTHTHKLAVSWPTSSYLIMKERLGVGWASGSNPGWKERSVDRVIPEPWRSRVTWSGSSLAVSEVKVMEKCWP